MVVPTESTGEWNGGSKLQWCCRQVITDRPGLGFSCAVGDRSLQLDEVAHIGTAGICDQDVGAVCLGCSDRCRCFLLLRCWLRAPAGDEYQCKECQQADYDSTFPVQGEQTGH